MKKIRFSIIIPVAPNRSTEVLKSLKKLDYLKKDYEIITKKGNNPSENRNNGIKEAKGEIIVLLDDDAIVNKNILKNAESFFKKYPQIGIVGGPQLTPKTDKFFAKVSGYVLSSFFGTHKMSKRYKKGKLDLNANEMSITSAICFVKKNVFKKIGYFNPKLFPGEDPEFFSRAKIKNIKIAYNPNLIIYHRRRSNLFSFIKQFFNYGKVRPKVNKKPNPIFFTPSLFVIYLILLPFLPTIFLIPLYLYILLDLLFSLFLAIKNLNIIALILLPFIFPIIHISYGIGLIYSLFK
ncbi:MAG: glycosyltransferase [Nanoarchaeota archaeon]|nr:glycosyltransferase [Nanoarchaeota archaeon]